MLRHTVRTIASDSSQSSGPKSQEGTRKDISTVDPFDAPTYHIPEKPVTFTEGASYSVIILAGLGVAGFAAYAVFKELIFVPKEFTSELVLLLLNMGQKAEIVLLAIAFLIGFGLMKMTLSMLR